MQLPNFLIIGSQKAGTTTLYHGLKSHPQIFMPQTKELNFFFHDYHYAQGLASYSQHFAPVNGETAVGEASPGYICHPDAPARIHAALPDTRLILTVREPVSRAYSQYWDNRRKLEEAASFAWHAAHSFHTTYRPGGVGYFSRGFYLTYIERFLTLFRREQLLIINFAALKTEAEATFSRIFAFLGVDPDFRSAALTARFNTSMLWDNPFYRLLFRNPELTRVTPAPLRRRLAFGSQQPFRYPPLKPQFKRALQQQYAAANQALADFLEEDLSPWNP